MPKSTTRSSADEIRAAIAAQIRNNFDYRNVRGLTENPTVTQNPTRQTTEPYIYVYSIGQVEIDSTKDDTPFQYQVAIEVTLRYSSYRGGQRQAEEIMNEVFAYVRGKNASEYPDLSAFGFNVYNTTTGDTEEFTDRLRGANYYRVVTSLYVTASFTGQEVQVQPIQDPEFTYSGFSYLPISNSIERYDAGNIVPAQAYTSPNNGWTFDNAVYTLPSTAQGVYDGTNYTLAATNEPVALDSNINYMMTVGEPTEVSHLAPGAGVRYRDSLTLGDWRIIGTGFGLFTIADGFAWPDITSSILRIQIAGDYSQTTLVTGDLIRLTVESGSWVEYTGTIVGTSTSLTISNVVFQASNGTISGISANNTPNQIQLDTFSPNIITTSLAATTSWSRIDSIRYGSVPASAGLQPTFPDDTSPTYGLRLLSNWNVEFGTTDPQNQSITITGDKDEYTYIIVNDAFTLNGIRDSLGTNNINNFDVVTDGNYRYYISKTPILFDNSSFTYTLST